MSMVPHSKAWVNSAAADCCYNTQMAAPSVSPAQSRLRQVFKDRPADPLQQVQEALGEGATPNDPLVQKHWLQTPSMWHDKPLGVLLKKAGLKACRGLPLAQAISSEGWSKLVLLIECGLDVNELGSALMAHPEPLVWEGLDLLEHCLAHGFTPTAQQVSFATLETEDEDRALLLAYRKHLDPNALCTMEDRGHPLTFAQALLLFSRQTIDLNAWIDAGADYTSLLGSGYSPATRLLADANLGASEKSPPIPLGRVFNLTVLAQNQMVKWLEDDAHGVQPIQAMRALHASTNVDWRALLDLAERQCLEQKMELSLPCSAPTPSRSRF